MKGQIHTHCGDLSHFLQKQTLMKTKWQLATAFPTTSTILQHLRPKNGLREGRKRCRSDPISPSEEVQGQTTAASNSMCGDRTDWCPH